MVERAFGDGRYTVIRELGRGGQKVVYLVHDRVLDRQCALALIEEAISPDAIARLRHEAQSLARMGTHPNIVTVHDMGEQDGRPYVVSEYVEGGDLGHEIAKGTIPVARALKIGQQILRALAFIHERGIVHRDLKPSNVWIAGDGTMKLGDFGLALAPDKSRLTLSNTVTGTPGYVSPEQLENRALDGRSDLYSFGCLLYELLTGRTPFVGNVVSVISQHLHAAPAAPLKHNPDIPAELDAFVLSLLAKSPEDRPASAVLALEQLDRMSGDQTKSAERPAPSVPMPPVKEVKPNRGWMYALLALVPLIALPFIFGVPGAQQETKEAPRRVVVVPTRDVGMTVNSTIAWALASRLVEVVDRYREFRPISHAGLLSARHHCLGGSDVVPDETDAQRIAEQVTADTVAALSIAKAGAEGEISVAIHVFSASDLASGVSTPRERISMSELDANAPARLGKRLAQALARQWEKTSLTDEATGMEDRATPFDAFQTYLNAQEHCVIGRYDRCEQLMRVALERDPNHPLFHSLMTCALSYQGKDVSAHEKIAMEDGPKLPSRLQRLHAQTSLLWVEAERFRSKGDLEGMRKTARRMMDLYQEFTEVWADPWGYMYGGATLQYFLDDSDGARRMYALGRAQGPMFYPPYYEEAKLVRGDGKSEAGNREAARLLWTFIECNPSSDLISVAREHVQEWRLLKPSDPLPCPRMANR